MVVVYVTEGSILILSDFMFIEGSILLLIGGILGIVKASPTLKKTKKSVQSFVSFGVDIILTGVIILAIAFAIMMTTLNYAL